MAMTLKPKTYETPELVFAHDRTAFIVVAKNETPPLEIYVDEHSAKTEKGWAYIKGPETVRIPVTPGEHTLVLYGGGRKWPVEADGSFGYTANFPETSAEPVEEPGKTDIAVTLHLYKETAKHLLDLLKAVISALEQGIEE